MPLRIHQNAPFQVKKNLSLDPQNWKYINSVAYRKFATLPDDRRLIHGHRNVCIYTENLVKLEHHVHGQTDRHADMLIATLHTHTRSKVVTGGAF